MSDNNEIIRRIKECYPQLSPTARLVANYIQEHPLALLSQSVADIASSTNSSKATVSRLFRQLGYESHQQARQTLTKMREFGMPIQSGDGKADYLKTELENVCSTLEMLQQHDLPNLARRIAQAKQVFLIGFRTSYPVALHCAQQLKQIREGVRILPQTGQSVAEQIADITPDDIVLVVGFRRRPAGFTALLQQLPTAQCVLFTDASGQTYLNEVTQLIVCQLGQSTPFDSYAGPMSVMATLCNLVYHSLGEKAANRAAEISNLYQNLHELSSD